MRIFTPDLDEEGHQQCMHLLGVLPVHLARPTNEEEAYMGAFTIASQELQRGNDPHLVAMCGYDSDTFAVLTGADWTDEHVARQIHRTVRDEAPRVLKGPLRHVIYVTGLAGQELGVNMFSVSQEGVSTLSVTVDPVQVLLGNSDAASIKHVELDGPQDDENLETIRVNLLRYREEIWPSS